MATAPSTMASHLKGSFASSFTRGLVTPKGISGTPFRALPSSSAKSSFTIKAIQSEKEASRLLKPVDCLVSFKPSWIPHRREPIATWYRGRSSPRLLSSGPFCDTEYAGAAGSLAAGGLVVILSICLTMYGIASFKEGDPSIAPSLTLTGRKKEPDQLQTADGWANFTGGFFFGGISGVTWAYFLLYVLDLPYFVK